MHGLHLSWQRLPYRQIIAALMLAVGALSLVNGQGTLAYFTSTATSTGNVFNTGTISLKLSDANETTLSAVTASFSSANFRPGDTVAGYVTVENAGTLGFDYGLNYTATNSTGTLWGVGTPPTLQVYTAAATGDCTSANAAGAKSGLTSRYSATAVSTTPNTVVFDSGAGTKRTLASSTNEILCFAVAWANGVAGAENTQQGASGTIVLNFDAR